MQVAEAMHKYGRELGARVVPVYGGQPITAQLHRLARGVDIVVATPGRAVDHLERGVDPPRRGRDRRARRGRRDARHGLRRRPRADPRVAARGPPDRAVLRHDLGADRAAGRPAPAASGPGPGPGRGDRRARRRGCGRSPTSSAGRTSLPPLAASSTSRTATATLVFARTRGEVDDLAEALSGRGRDAAALHGGLAQEQRDRIMGRFRDGALDVLVATDVAARGLDIEQVTHVVNYDVPVVTGRVRPPHRPHRTRWPRGRRDHARRAARAPAAARHRADDRRAARARRAADGRRRPREAARDPARRRCARRCSGTGSTATARSSSRCRTSSTSSTSRSPRSASPTRAREAPRTPPSSPRPRCRPPSVIADRGIAARLGVARSPPSRAVRRSGRRRAAVHRRVTAPRRRTGRRPRAQTPESRVGATDARRDPIARSRKAPPRRSGATA